MNNPAAIKDLSELPKAVEKQNAESLAAILYRIEEKQDAILAALAERDSQEKAPKDAAPRCRNLMSEVLEVLQAVMKPGAPHHALELVRLANECESPKLVAPLNEGALNTHARKLVEAGKLIRVRASVYQLPAPQEVA